MTIIPETIVVKGAAARAPQRARDAPRPARLGRDQRQQRGVEHRAEAAAARAAGVPLDRARRRRLDGGGVPEAERRARLEPVHRRAARLRHAVAELRLRATSTATSATTRPAASRSAPPATARCPADGWSGDAEWTGWIPFEELPHLYDPPEHFIVTANHRPAPPSYPLSARPRVAGAVPRPADPRSPRGVREDGPRRPEAHRRRLRAHPGRHAVAAREGAAAAPPLARASGRRAAAAGGRRCCRMGWRIRPGQRRRGDLRRLVPPPDTGRSPPTISASHWPIAMRSASRS